MGTPGNGTGYYAKGKRGPTPLLRCLRRGCLGACPQFVYELNAKSGRQTFCRDCEAKGVKTTYQAVAGMVSVLAPDTRGRDKRGPNTRPSPVGEQARTGAALYQQKALERENHRLKQQLAQAQLNNPEAGNPQSQAEDGPSSSSKERVQKLEAAVEACKAAGQPTQGLAAELEKAFARAVQHHGWRGSTSVYKKNGIYNIYPPADKKEEPTKKAHDL